MPMNPDVMMARPMSRNPAPIGSVVPPVARSMDIKWPVANLYVKTQRVRRRRSKSADAQHCRKNQSDFFHNLLLLTMLDELGHQFI
jgi:hypothetical protein